MNKIILVSSSFYSGSLFSNFQKFWRFQAVKVYDRINVTLVKSSENKIQVKVMIQMWKLSIKMGNSKSE